MKSWVIQEIQSNSENPQLYWHNEDGWTEDIEYADTFSESDKLIVTLPDLGEWIKK